jgi:hypothetical protein
MGRVVTSCDVRLCGRFVGSRNGDVDHRANSDEDYKCSEVISKRDAGGSRDYCNLFLIAFLAYKYRE